MTDIDILDIIESIYNVENSKKFIENYIINESMFDERNPINKGLGEQKNTFSQCDENYPQNKSGNVDNYFFGDLYNTGYENVMKNITKGVDLKGFGGKDYITDELLSNREKAVKNYRNSFENLINTILSDRYVHNVVDNLLMNVKNTDVINNFVPMEENFKQNKKLCSVENDSISRIIEKNTTKFDNISQIYEDTEKSYISSEDRAYIPQAMEKNYNNSDNSSSININMGGITQNITGQNGEDILDILVEKLVRGINTGGESPR